jgi:putative DNA primase/helicase
METLENNNAIIEDENLSNVEGDHPLSTGQENYLSEEDIIPFEDKLWGVNGTGNTSLLKVDPKEDEGSHFQSNSDAGESILFNPYFPLSDSGNAELIVSLFHNKLRFDHDLNKSFIYGRQYWQMDNKDTTIQLGKAAARTRQQFSVYIEDSKLREKQYRFGLRSENLSKIRNAVKIAQTDDRIAVETSDWPDNVNLIQFNNGLYDIEAKAFRDGTPEDMIRQSVGYKYDADAICPIWEKVLLEMMDENSEMVRYIQTAIGYSLTGKTTEQCLFFLTGEGANGKSVFLNMLLLLMGSYALNTPFSAFEAKKRSGNSNDLARLIGSRIVTSSESSESGRINEERIKAMTGSDPITARLLYKEHVTFNPSFKIWAAVNTLPEISGTDNGIWRRIRVIPFNVSFLGREDPYLSQKLRNELPGIMNWAIEGAIEWMQHGLTEPQLVVDAVKEYRTDSNIVMTFLDSAIHLDLAERVQSSVLFREYTSYCNGAGFFAVNQTKFGREMRSLGYKSAKFSGSIWYLGISLKSSPTIPDRSD